MRSELNFPPLAVAESEDGGVRVIALSGELDLASVGDLQAAFDALSGAGRQKLCLDLTELRFIDSSGLASVIRAQMTIAEAGGALAIVCVAGAVQRTVKTTGLLEMLTVLDTRAAALDALAG
ncbi:MAG: STAS domain-containing protein [Actinobacteria bacterium]|nr:STAS domain-containing protein [Actinomycetota bacterium]